MKPRKPSVKQSKPPADLGSPVAGRSGGVLLHVTSLPSRWGVGDLGPGARQWVDLLADSKQQWWQILPLNPPSGEHSPYQAFSAFAGNPLLISPDDLITDKLLPPDIRPMHFAKGEADYMLAAPLKVQLLVEAAKRFFAGKRLHDAFDQFCFEQKFWLDDYALFMALHSAHDNTPWQTWPADLVQRKPAALRSARTASAGQIAIQKFAQFIFDRQLQKLRAYAAERGVKIIGDLPIFIAGDSADVWTNPHLFQLDRNRQPTAVAGVPPDMFSDLGQRWGNPLYDWDAMAAEGYAWWRARLRATLRQCDLVRLDHFRGFEAYWRIPAKYPDARRGRWVKGPGAGLFRAFQKDLGALPIIAEDLGVITPEVEKLRDDFGLPGMRILQFGFGDTSANPHLPHNYVPNCVTYPGTHDNDTTLGWYRSQNRAIRARVAKYAGCDMDEKQVPMSLARLAWASSAKLAIVALQDVMALPGSARMNTPGKHRGNWRWRLDRFADARKGLEQLAALSELYGRMNS